jgi:Fe-S cluster biogenesis protein NfuA
MENGKSSILSRIETALNHIRPHLRVDGGDIEVVGVTDDLIVEIKWLGTCENCNMSAMTMRASIEETIKDKVPEIKAVVALNGLFSS